jgi:hypothetical protein
VRACQASWRNHNPDWTLNALTRESLPAFLDDDPQLEPDEVASDLIRMELLHRFGGIWVDSTTYCLWPLDEWINHAVSSGFFAFNRSGPDRMLANWFLAAQLACRIIDIWHSDTLAYWNGGRNDTPTIGIMSYLHGRMTEMPISRQFWMQRPSCRQTAHIVLCRVGRRRFNLSARSTVSSLRPLKPRF